MRLTGKPAFRSRWAWPLLTVGLGFLSIALIQCSSDLPPMTSSPAQTEHAYTNRLAQEKSPYLLQHQHNPVDWYPWGDEAFARARKENKPVFLSIGYSTCHWCHVMERESFENERITEILNKYFVCIKVDREERPDVDKIYMTFVQATSGGGGWPLNVFLTPDRKPFFGGTYFPPEDRPGHKGFPTLLQDVHQAWEQQREAVTKSADALHERLQALVSRPTTSDANLSPEILTTAVTRFKEEYDPRNGGFGSAPKFPRPTQPAFLLSQAARQKDDDGISMVLHTCRRMAAGGMHDQLGGGFARYSVDEEWLVPHFEKMLYDNAQLAHLYLDAYLVSGEEAQATVARDILDYVLRDMTHSNGGFFSAEDADSEGHEGKFYCWTQAELPNHLEPDELSVITRYYGITDQGNFVDHSHPTPLPHQNVLHIADPTLSPAEASLLTQAKEKLLAARTQRVRPHLDDKILASWNGLMLGAFARAYAVLGETRYLTAAERNLTFIRETLWDPETRTLHHRWRDGERDSVQLLDAYAFLLQGVIQTYEVTLNPDTLQFAIDLAETMIARFYDQDHGGFWQGDRQAKDLILQVKEDYDGAEPSGNSVAILALLKLAAITDRSEFRDTATKSLAFFAERLNQLPQAVPNFLIALDFSLQEPFRIVIAGDPESAVTQDLLLAAQQVYQPNKVILGNHGPVEAFAKTLPEKDGPLAYVCTGTACQPPTENPAELKALLK